MKGNEKGHLHAISRAIMEIAEIFGEIGFEVASGREDENERNNSDALNNLPHV